MKNLFRPVCLLLYLLTVIAFFFGGMTYAGLSGAAEGQGLAGGAIVFFYGVIAAGIAFITSMIICYSAENKTVKILNWSVFGLIIIVGCLMFYNSKERERKKLEREQNKKYNYFHEKEEHFKKGNIASDFRLAAFFQDDRSEIPQGLGFFKPDFFEHSVLYFYGNPNLEKSVQEQMPNDSIVFKQLETGGFEITYAPPWLVPDHMKLDYEIMYFRVQSLGRDLIEVTVNTTDQRTAYIDKNAGEIFYWPEFFMIVSSVEFKEKDLHIVRNIANDAADEITVSYDFMKPGLIKEEWMMVDLYNDNFDSVGKGWIRWRNGNEILITYSLLS